MESGKRKAQRADDFGVQGDKRNELRRSDDVERRVTRAEFDELIAEVRENTALTKDIHDLLTGLKVMAHIAKWVTVISAMIGALVLATKQIMGIKL